MTRPKPVLVDVDDESIRDTIALALATASHEVMTAPDGASALELVQRWPPQMILLDMKMPDMDGAATGGHHVDGIAKVGWPSTATFEQKRSSLNQDRRPRPPAP